MVHMTLLMARNETYDYGTFADRTAALMFARDVIALWHDNAVAHQNADPAQAVAEWERGCGEVFQIQEVQ